ncbi:PREDICTED: ataxin-10 [Nelumbo nucifera]|uniref:Ataxin-10 n=1 Tax=Nelumbo nucifera TaxID=4432 RepID=A0A1U8PZB0_NELNU|nr:PREDICTED: ataxin-10 [Nelumbo nucifera]XP_019051878.1 PREDICTED: ataxin-10 [Nelumbo nucifera]XP_019051879.1 PREDICTED: ataxin-10 [Nelumbo nucifera]XP_019051880.1 PREDICTED: ataxin-10 [Nelumbo nucifera]XP_019051881.1 PREDICTED: ataxin-10 [Nelumbo nucifera]XP_019051882.1 PREDICTED: ataxin-10 [Nelumbo nucifera]
MEDTLPMEFSVPESILQPLLIAANSSRLDEALECLLEAARTAHGRSDLASHNILLVGLQLSQLLSNSSAPHLLALSLRLLRNLCAGEIVNQNSFINENGVKIILLALKSVGLGSNPDYGIFRIGLQVLGNVSLAGEEHRSAIWGQFFPVWFVEIASIRRPEISDALSMVLYNCCNGSHERIGELCGIQGLPIVAEIIRTASTVGFREDWLKLLLSRVFFEDNHFPQLFSKLSSAQSTIIGGDVDHGDSLFTAAEVFLLSTLSEVLNQKIEEIIVSNDFAFCVLEILRRSVVVIDSCSRGKSGLPTGFATIDVLGYSITILRDICAREDMRSSKEENSVDVVSTLLSSGLIELMLDLLRDLEPPAIIRKSIKKVETQEGPSSSDSPKVCPYKGFRRDIVAVIGNCLYRRKYVQDLIRKNNGILLLMQQCVTDEDNPFLREWGIWSIRNLLEGNAENQRVVAELELQGSVDIPEISGLGLRVEVDQKTRRAKLVNVS